ncbi:isocitrate lyase/PEP mutase family protein [Sphingomonadaceae bacterium G21617-S1]|nr:isocitrate lyase/PEP mutase family protein [Sphingomonadaceae bacterium G21617-S1]
MTDRKRLKDSSGRLRKLLDEQSCVIMPGCYDAMSARLSELAGFEAGMIGGYSVETALLGCPDLGIMTLTELTDHANRIAAAVDIPLICDVDTGFGGIHNIARTVRELERAGIAGMHIEDQVIPKRCPALDGRQVIPIDDAVVRIQAAIEARSDNFVVIARCDADAVSYAELVKRCRRYLEAGADLVLPMLINFEGRLVATMSPHEQMELYGRLVKDIDGPVMGLMIPEGYTTADVVALGYKVLGRPALLLEAAANALRDCLEEARDNGTAARYFERNPRRLTAGRPLMEVMRLEDYLGFEDRLKTPLPPRPYRR